MATSGTSTYTETKLQIIQAAFGVLAIYSEGMTISAFDLDRASNTLNAMMKAWNKNPHLWTREEGVLFFAQYNYKYTLGNTQPSTLATTAATKLSNLTTVYLAADVPAGATNIPVSTVTGVQIGAYIGIVLANKSLMWTTTASFGVNNSINISSPLPSNATANGLVYSFVTPLTKPLSIKNMRSVAGIDKGSTSTLTELPMEYMAYNDFQKIPVKTVNSYHVTQGTFNPNRLTSDIEVFPRPSDCSYRMYFTYARSLEDVVNSAEELDVPTEWLEAVVWQLALRLAPQYGRLAAMQAIVPIASTMLSDLNNWDNENEYIDVGVDLCN